MPLYSTSSSLQNIAGRRGGFTLVELIMAVALTALLALCVASLASATAGAWRVQQQAVAGRFAGDRTAAQLDQTLRAAKDVLVIRQAQSSFDDTVVAIWASDDFAQTPLTAGDAKPQLYEVRFLVRQAGDSRLILRSAPPFAQLGVVDQGEAVKTFDQSYADAVAAYGAAGIPTWMRSTPLLGGDDGAEVTGVDFAIDRDGRAPVFSYSIDVRAGDAAAPPRNLGGSVLLRLATVVETAALGGNGDDDDD